MKAAAIAYPIIFPQNEDPENLFFAKTLSLAKTFPGFPPWSAEKPRVKTGSFPEREFPVFKPKAAMLALIAHGSALSKHIKRQTQKMF